MFQAVYSRYFILKSTERGLVNFTNISHWLFLKNPLASPICENNKTQSELHKHSQDLAGHTVQTMTRRQQNPGYLTKVCIEYCH